MEPTKKSTSTDERLPYEPPQALSLGSVPTAEGLICVSGSADVPICPIAGPVLPIDCIAAGPLF